MPPMSSATTMWMEMETPEARKHVLNFTALNEAILYKELFLAYLGAALLEPVLAIAGMEEAEGWQLVINSVTLLAICWWIWILNDAFDFNDIVQAYKYRIDFGAGIQEQNVDWIEFGTTTTSRGRGLARRGLASNIRRDIMLWFMLACITAAWIPSTIGQRDVMHAYVILLLWTLMHHTCRRAISGDRSYLFTYFSPSAALMPLEYCLPLADVENTVEDLDFVVSYREYIKNETGVALILQS